MRARARARARPTRARANKLSARANKLSKSQISSPNPLLESLFARARVGRKKIFLYRGLLLTQRFQKKWDFNLGIFDLVVCYGFVLFVSLSLVYLFSALFCPICISSLFLGFESVVFFISSLTSFCFILIFF